MEINIVIRFSILGLFILGTCFGYDPATCIQCRESHMCNPPDCFCCRDKMPLQTHRIPQMVFFTFDDAVNPQVASYYKELFNPKRRNPNGCPVSMTLFVSHRNTVYSLVKEFYEKGMEIASHSVTHSHMNTNTFIREARKQKENLSKRAGIPSDKITGWRSPFLEPVGDLQPSVLKDLGYEYDATLTVAKKDPKDKAVTPFTLDFGWPYDCKIKPCPVKSHKGFWEVPVVSVKDYLDKYDCVYVDGCNNPPPTERHAYNFLWDNFQKYYTTNRAPMGINMHASWFYYPDRKAAMDKFIKKLVKIDDVYIVSVKQVIEWLRNPTALDQIKTFPPWLCNTTSAIQQGNPNFDIRAQRKRLREKSFRPQSTRIGNFISNGPRKGISSRNWNTPRPLGRQQQQSLPSTMPTASPPLVPNLPMVHFWWRPPNMVDNSRQISARRQEQQNQDLLRRKQLEEERLRRVQAEKQTKMLEQKRQEELRQKELTKQADLLKRQNERKRAEELQLHRKRIQELARQRLHAAQQQKAEEARTNELKRNQAVKQQRKDRQKQALVKPQRVSSVESEFLGLSESNTHQTSAPRNVIKPIRTFNEFRNAGNQLQMEMEPQTPLMTSPTTNPTPTINHQEVLEKSFQKFISMKLDEILEHQPSDRTKHLEKLSIAELRALQEELRNRLTPGSSVTPAQDITKATTRVRKLSSNIARLSAPYQNQILPENKPILNEFHTPEQVQRTKINNFQSLEISKQDTLSEYTGEQYVDPIINEFMEPVYLGNQIDPKELLITNLRTTKTNQVKETRKIMPLTTQITSTVRPKAQTTLPTTRSLPSSTLAPTSSTTQTTVSPTTKAVPKPSTTSPPTSPTPIPTTTTTTTTTKTTTKVTTESTPQTTTLITSTAKLRIPVIQRWPVSQNKKLPWQRWMTDRPVDPRAESSLSTATPTVFQTKRPSQMENFAIRKMKKTQSLFNVQSLESIMSSSNNKLNNDIVSDQVNDIQQQPKAFVNDPMTLDIAYNTNGQTRPDAIAGVNLSMNRFSSPVNQKLRSLRIFNKVRLETATKPQAPVQHKTTFSTNPSTTAAASPITTTIPMTSPVTTSTPKKTTSDSQTTLQGVDLNTDLTGNIPKQDQSGIQQQMSRDIHEYVVPGNASETIVSSMALQVSDILQSHQQPKDVSVFDWQLSRSSSKCLQEVNCFRPDCVCRKTSAPDGMRLEDTPQIVYITVDGSLNFHTYGKMRALFSRSRKNPNGCRIKGTVFVTDTGSSYRIANVLQKDGVELGMMGVSSRPYNNATILERDLTLQKRSISANANLLKDGVKGWRSPGFRPVGDEQFEILANNSLYDSSILLRAAANDLPLPWPYTLDFGLKETCEKGTCPLNRHMGVWEVPSIPLIGPKNSTACEYVDACTLQPETKQETVDFLMKNFKAYYKTNKAPFAIRLKQMWFHWYYRDNFAGLLMFLDKILGLGDVYVTSVSDTIDWMKSPKTLTEINQLKNWKC